MKHFRMLAAGLCSAVLLCGFAIPAYAYSDGGNEEPPVVEETPAPEPAPTITPGEGFSEDGNLVTRDLLYDAATNKQFITVETSGGNTFYIVIDYDKPVDEDGEQYHTYFLNMVDDTANHDERRAILQQFIKEIRVRKDYEISITLNASFNQVEQLKAVSTYDGAEIFEGISEKGA